MAKGKRKKSKAAKMIGVKSLYKLLWTSRLDSCSC